MIWSFFFWKGLRIHFIFLHSRGGGAVDEDCRSWLETKPIYLKVYSLLHVTSEMVIATKCN